jgi:hypothetical protein
MARSRQRVRLEGGLKLDINHLLRRGRNQPGSKADLSCRVHGWMRVKSGSLDQRIELVSLARPYGGRQWYFLCPRTGRRASVLWKPPGAPSFACRQAWGRQVAYGSQFQSPYRRACSGAEAIRDRLGGRRYSEWSGELPPRPKGMHRRTYEREIARIETYENACNFYLLQCIARIL